MPEIKKQEDGFLNIKELWEVFLSYWPWFFLSVGFCLAIAVAYIVVTPPTFTRKATIMITNNNRKQGASNMDPLAEMGIFKQTTDAQSEVYVLKSPQLMESVVRRLGLENNYTVKYRSVRYVDLYTSSPVAVALDSIASILVKSLDIKLLDSGKVELSNFNKTQTESSFSAESSLGEWVETPYGSVRVNPTPSYPGLLHQTIHFTRYNPAGIAKTYIGGLSVTIPEDNVPAIELSYVDVNPQRAEDILNTLIAIYNENWINDKNQITMSTSRFIGERLNIIENELGSVDQDISQYKSENLITDITAVSGVYLAQSTTNTSQLNALQNQLSLARYIRSSVNDATSKNQLIPANTGLENRAVEAQIEKFNATMLQKNNLASNSSENNPVVADLIQLLNSMRDGILRSIDEYLSTLNIQLDLLRQEEKSTNQKIASSPTQARHLLSIERQQKVKEALYLFLLQKREENELAQTFTAYNTKLINPPSGSFAPTAPRRNIVLLFALFIGLLIPALILLIKETMNTIVREKKDIDKLNIPFIGEIPYLSHRGKRSLFKRGKKKPQEKVMLVVENKNRNIVNEAFRSIRTNIDFMRPKSDRGTVIMTTSLHPGSGKTFITINVAMTMVLKGARTLVIDLDLRMASLSTVVGSPKAGIANYLNGSVEDTNKLIVKGMLNSALDILPVGKIPPNPSELLLDGRFTGLIEKLRGEYDYIFLDCPPVSIVTDTEVIGQYVDLTLFVIRAGLMDKRLLPEVEELHSERRLKNMALILNGLDLASGGTYGYRRYGYSKYGYGKTYGSKKAYGYDYGYGNGPIEEEDNS